MQQTQVTG